MAETGQLIRYMFRRTVSKIQAYRAVPEKGGCIKVRVLLVEPRKVPYEAEIEDGLKAMQEIVGGYIQAIYPFKDPVAVICNDEGKLLGLPLNRALRDEDNSIYDVIAGNFFIAGIGGEDLTDLPAELMEKYKELFFSPEIILRDKEGLIVCKVG